jgi:hypothetical protein
MKRPKIRALPIVSGVLVLGLGGVVGWLSIQEPLPDSLPYQVNLPYTEPSGPWSPTSPRRRDPMATPRSP